MVDLEVIEDLNVSFWMREGKKKKVFWSFLLVEE